MAKRNDSSLMASFQEVHLTERYTYEVIKYNNNNNNNFDLYSAYIANRSRRFTMLYLGDFNGLLNAVYKYQ